MPRLARYFAGVWAVLLVAAAAFMLYVANTPESRAPDASAARAAVEPSTAAVQASADDVPVSTPDLVEVEPASPQTASVEPTGLVRVEDDAVHAPTPSPVEPDDDAVFDAAAAAGVSDLVATSGLVAGAAERRSANARRTSIFDVLIATGLWVPPSAPGAGVVPAGRTAFDPSQPVLLALGDSLAAGVGVSDPRESYVSRFHAFLEGQSGETRGLVNLGVPGETTTSMMRRQLQQALQVLRDDDVATVTLSVGANDLLVQLGSPDCRGDMHGDACRARLDDAVAAYAVNFEAIVSQLAAALEPGTAFYVVNVYNPFDFGIGLRIEVDSNEYLRRMNDVSRETAETHGARYADAFSLMAGNAGIWTNMLSGDIHPNADGFQALAYALTRARVPESRER